MNALNTPSNLSHEQNNFTEKKAPQNTIRSVASDSISRDQSPARTGTMPHSTKTLPSISTSHPPQTHQPRPNNGLAVGNGLVRTISAEFGATRTYTSPNLSASEEPSHDTVTSPQWSSAVGRANLGKSGRVIERLMGENDMLKRDLKLEQLRAEESRQSLKMAQESKQGLISDYETKLHDAAISKALLKRKERQLADLKAQIDGERQRADSAVERERSWREAMEKSAEEAKAKVEEAQTYAALMEGRNSTMANHWKDQNAELERAVTNMSSQIRELVSERLTDDRKIQTLQGLCEQQREMLADLEGRKEAVGSAFENYKLEQENQLRDIKTRAREQEGRNERAIEETLEVLGKLKWALAVEKNVKLDR